MKHTKPLVIGRSVEGRPIEVRTMHERLGTLIIGGFHGDEPATIEIVRRFLPGVPGVALLPLLNPDGARLKTRYNARGVDLNRNFEFNWHEESVEPPGPHPLSEPESKALVDFILARRPAKIVSLHWALGEIDADGAQSTLLAETMWEALTERERAPYRLRVTEPGRGQGRLEQTYVECPGSLGQWVGYGIAYPDGTQPAMVTLELPFDPDISRPDDLPPDHWQIVQRRWREDSAGYLAGVRPGVEKMLHAACRC
ncbi:MAG: M14 family zinc carboxypeptidase [Chthoniobacteraceae bacterium]